MDYHEASNFLFDLRRFSVDPGTASVRALLDHLGNPEDDLAFVQIAGSNGKGSTARIAESVLRRSGLSVGLYTSPHLDDLSERVRVDGRSMNDEAIAAFLTETRPWLVDRAAAGDPLTFFEVVTAMAVWDFARRGADVAVLEVGLGGEHDATSAIDPVATAVTNVSLEHTDVLGDSIEAIARTKARIAVEGAPLVTACEGEALTVVREVVVDAGGEVTTVAGPDESRSAAESATDVTAIYHGRAETRSGQKSPTDARIEITGREWNYDARIPLVGRMQATNAAIAVAVAHETMDRLDGLDGPEKGLTDDHVREGLARADWPGRFEVVEADPLVVLDGAHNPAACGMLAETLGEYEFDDLHLVFAAMHEKDHEGIAAALPEATSIITCAPDVPRAEDPEVLAAAFDRAGTESVEAIESVENAFKTARLRADSGDCVLLTGSLFAVAEARSTYTRRTVPKRANTLAEAETILDGANVTEHDRDRHRGEVVHRLVTMRLDRSRAEAVRRELLAAGGTCAVSGAADGELIDVVLGGTIAQFHEACDALSGIGGEFAGIVDTIRERIDLDTDSGSSTTRSGRPWEDGPVVMGILNVTPDSFHDGGKHAAHGDAIAAARRMIDDGARIVDLGGESTRPGAAPVPIDEEIERVVPVVEALQSLPAIEAGDVSLSVDTRKPAVAAAALDAGADIINDVTGLEDPRMREVVAEAGCPVVLMHSVETPVDPETDVEYEDVVEDVIDELEERILRAQAAGIDREDVLVDPGLGFGKSSAENFELLGRLEEFAALECPILVGHSHKSMYGAAGYGPDEREHTTVAGTALAVERGADVVRVHDVAENQAAVDVVTAARDPDRLEE
ncbi:dihydropteroate synthase [Halopenitus sp. H-Gu1]|uniref:dihydropteroate synthase n=1 Tax=Halopenitus sp. H-Gu1 TaxID=3242697 RepID=UPI00359EBD41